METFGETIRQIRKEKGYTIAELAQGIVSVSFLSKFERGESEISLSHFNKMLKKMALSFDEFFFIHNQYEQDDLEIFFNSVYDAYNSGDLYTLNKLKVAEDEKWNTLQLERARCNSAMLEVFKNVLLYEENTVAQEEIDFLSEYLFKVEVWGYYELRLYNSTLLLLSPELVATLTKTAYQKSYHFKDFPKYYKTIVSILMNTLIYLMGGQYTHAYIAQYETFKSYITSMDILEEDLFNKNQLMFIEGIYKIKTGNREKGIKLATAAVRMLEQLDAPNIAIRLETYLEFVLEHND